MKISINRITTKISGAEIYTLYLLESLKKNLHFEIELVTNNKELYKRASKINIKSTLINPGIGEIGTKKHFIKALFVLPKFIKKYKELYKDNSEIIIFESMTEKIFLTALFARKDFKIFWIEHGPLFSTQRALIIKYLYARASNYTKKIIAVSQNTKDDLINGGVSSDIIKVIYIGIPKSTKNITTIKLNLPKKYTVVGFIGSIVEAKGIFNFVDYAKYILKQDKNYRFLVLGDGSELENVKSYIKTLGLQNAFIFTGFIDTKSYLPSIDILLFPTKHSEGISIAILEALSYGVPVVTSDAGGNKEIVFNGINGYICPKYKAKDYYQAIVKIDKDKKSFSKNAKKVINEKFNNIRMVQEYKQLFANIINE